MIRWLMLFLPILLLCSLLWPTLQRLGRFGLPGDLEVVAFERAFDLPLATALLISLAVVGAWRLLDRP